MTRGIWLMLAVNVTAIAVAIVIAFNLFGVSGIDEKLDSRIDTLANEIEILAFGNAGLAWFLFTRREKAREQEKERNEFYRRFSETASAYFSALGFLEVGRFENSTVQAAERAMSALDGVVTHDLIGVQQQLWREFFQTGLDITALAQKCASDEEKRQLWKSYAAKFTAELWKVQKLDLYSAVEDS